LNVKFTKEASTPLAMPENFNPETLMLSKTTEYGTFHESRKAAGFAEVLVANGAPEDLVLAEKVLDATLRCQELHEDDAHYGNFFWMREDEAVTDLNAVEFVLEKLIPMMIQHGDRLSPDMQTRVLTSIRLGLDEVRRLDVLVAYTNITVLDIVNTCLGGELLAEPAIAQRGYQKLVAWIAFTSQYGIPFEYNSPTYTAVTLRALKQLTDLVQDEPTRVRARTMAARLGLSVALHIHGATGRWAGPHSRAYHPTVVCETEPEIMMLRRWAEDGTVPTWVLDALDARPEPMTVAETAYPERAMGFTTYHGASFALGVAATDFGAQANALIAHYVRPSLSRPTLGKVSRPKPGVLYTRYIINDKWFGDAYHATDRTKSRNLLEEGRFIGVQDGPRAIGLYAPRRLGLCTSAKACLIWTGREHVDEVWVGQRQVETLPITVEPGEIIVVGSGDVWIAVWPLTVSDLGHDAPMRLVERAGDVVLELYNYLGPEKSFWEMNWPGAFYQGQPQCGFYVEVAERAMYPDGRIFANMVISGDVVDDAASPFVYAGERERPWTVAYRREGRELGLEVDLMQWQLKRRWTHEGDLGWPMLASPIARESRDGRVTVGDVTLRCGPEAGWLWVNPKEDRWVAGYQGLQPAPLRVMSPTGGVALEGLATGVVVWDQGEVEVEGIGIQGEPRRLPPV
jgi:hypothetical protein